MDWLSRIFEGPNRGVSWDSRAEFEDFDRAIAMSLAEGRRRHGFSDDFLRKEDELLAKALHGRLKLEPPPWNRNMNRNANVHQPAMSISHSTGYRKCAGCNNVVSHGQYLRCMGVVWHPECLNAMRVTCQFLIMSFYCREIIRITSLAIEKTITHDVMSAATLFEQMLVVLLNIRCILSGLRNTARIMNVTGLLGVVAVIVSSQRKYNMLLLMTVENYAWSVLILQSWVPQIVNHCITIYNSFSLV